MNPTNQHDDDDYLFSKQGTPDPEARKLEELLAPLGHRGPSALERFEEPGTPIWTRFGMAAAGILLGLAITFAARHWMGSDDEVGGIAIRCESTGEELREGSWIESRGGTREVQLSTLGRVTLEAGTRLQVRSLAADETRLYLERGAIEARISADARPRFFQVETDAALCVDLGCRYTLEVEEIGVAARVRVSTGRVAFEEGGREMYVPAGAECRARRGSGPGTPRFEDAPAELRTAFDALDASAPGAGEERVRLALAALDTVRAKRDTLAAWHLLQENDARVIEATLAKLESVAGVPELAAGADASRDAACPAPERERWKQHLDLRCW